MGNNDSKLDWSLDSKDNPSGDDKDISKWKVMLQALCTDNIEQVESALKDWNMTASEARNLIVQSKDEYGYNTLHLVVMSASRETIVQLLNFITDDEAKQELILNSDNITRSNVLHLVARTNSIRRSVSRCLTEENQTRGLKALDYKERTPIQIALTSRPQAALSMICKLPDEDFHQYVTEALNKNLGEGFSRAQKKSDDRLLLACIQHDDVGVIERLKTSDYPLSSSQINILSPLFHDFIVPKKQSITKKQGLVCYCAAEREGAKEEAETLKAALKDVGFSVQVYEWKLFSEMRTWLTQSVNEIALETSVLFLAVMSHGFSGNVSGEDGSYGELSDVLDITRSGIPAHIPIIGLVQACQAENKNSHDYISEPSTSGQQQERLEEQQLKQQQEQQLGHEQEQQQHQQMITEHVGGYAPHGQTDNGDLHTDSTPQVPAHEDAAMVPKSDSQHIILRSQEVAIMIATVHGGKAYRGRFTQAFSRVLLETSGKRNIFELFQRAARLLIEEQELRKQIPEFRSTLTKTLSL